MSFHEIFQVILFLIALLTLSPILGTYMAKVYKSEKHLFQPVFGWLEKLLYRLSRIDPTEESDWKNYLFDMLIFNFFGFLILFILQILQSGLLLNPQGFPGISWHLAINTAVSFVTNTNWQSYAGESVMGYLVQMAGLTVQNFLSAATGMAIMLALVRGITRKLSPGLGNFWVDLTRSTLYILLPLSILLAIILMGEGVIQNFNHYEHVKTITGATQVIPGGPAASQIAIKQIGTNGGGFFNANSAHPFENPTPFSNFLEMLAILLIPAGLTITYGKMAGSAREGWTLFITMMILFSAGLFISLYSEYHTAAAMSKTALMEGKETRFGVTNSILWSAATTAASNGSVNAMHDSLSPFSGMIAMFNIMLGEVIFGGVGSGIYGMVMFVLLTVFIAGLMVGRTPEYLGKKVESFEIRMAILAVLLPSVMILLFSAFAVVSPAGLAGLNNQGPHGLSEILYAFTSAAGNNGSAFAGLTSNTVFYNLGLAFVMIAGRFGVIIPVMAIAGSMAGKKITPNSAGTFRTDNWLFITLLIGVILIIGGLTFFPVLAIGPVMEHFLILRGIVF